MFLFSSFSVFNNLFLSSKASLFPLISILIFANSSPASLMAWSLLEIISVTSCHCKNNLCLSSCYLVNSSEVLSSSIYAVWVSVISFSNSYCFLPTSAVNLCICRFNSLILTSSALLYFSKVRLSSSFYLAAKAHCSNSSWFQLISSLFWSIFSFPLKI